MSSTDWLPDSCLAALQLMHPVLGNHETPWLLVGAIARDYAFRDLPEKAYLRATMDLDMAICVPTWEEFSTIIETLCDLPEFERENTHRLLFRGGLPVDIIPFGGVEDTDGQISWPPDGDPTMNMLGFQDVHQCSHEVMLNSTVRIQIAQAAGTALLKIVAYTDRPNGRKKDLQDLVMFVENYVDLLGGWDVAFEKHPALLEQEYDRALPMMLGRDIRLMLSNEVAEKVRILLETHSASDESPCVWDLMPYVHQSQADSFRLIRGIHDGFTMRV